jgi:hypothetical protein
LRKERGMTRSNSIEARPRTELEKRAFNLRAAAAAVNEPMFAPKIARTCESEADFLEKEVAELRAALEKMVHKFGGLSNARSKGQDAALKAARVALGKVKP